MNPASGNRARAGRRPSVYRVMFGLPRASTRDGLQPPGSRRASGQLGGHRDLHGVRSEPPSPRRRASRTPQGDCCREPASTHALCVSSAGAIRSVPVSPHDIPGARRLLSGSVHWRRPIERSPRSGWDATFGVRRRPTDSTLRLGLSCDRLTCPRSVVLPEPPTVMEPAAQCTSRWTSDRPRLTVTREVIADLLGMLAGGESAFGLAPQVRPCVRPGAIARHRAANAAQVGAHRSGMPTIRDARRTPHRGEARDEIAATATPLEGVAAMRFAEPDRHAMSEVMLAPRPVARATADRAHRKLPDPRPLVVADGHGRMITRTDVTPPTRFVKGPCRDRANFRAAPKAAGAIPAEALGHLAAAPAVKWPRWIAARARTKRRLVAV